MTDHKWFRIGLWTLLLFTIVGVGAQIDFLFRPLVIVIQTLFVLILAGVLFFLLRPLVRLLVSWKVPRTPDDRTHDSEPIRTFMNSLPLFIERAINTGYFAFPVNHGQRVSDSSLNDHSFAACCGSGSRSSRSVVRDSRICDFQGHLYI